MSARRGDWICTASGRQFWPLDPRPEDVCIEDISHALSHLCRFGGHCRWFYSVAQHSWSVAALSQPEDALAGLLHDAAEAYIVDLPRPIKMQDEFRQYRDAEYRVLRAVFERFGLKPKIPFSVLDADEIMLATEARDIMGMPAHRWTLKHEPSPTPIEEWSPQRARAAFLGRFEDLIDTYGRR